MTEGDPVDETARTELAPQWDANHATNAGTDGAPGPAHLADPRALAILTTEHWSLLTARSLVYNEAFARAGMFLTFLSASLVALGFVSRGGSPGPDFPLVAAAVLSLDLLIGLATLGRLVNAGAEDFRALQGMSRLRHAYLEMVPSLEPYFTTSRHDDMAGVLATYGTVYARPDGPRSILHGLTTTPGMIAAIDAAVAAALAATVALGLGLAGGAALAAGVIVGLLVLLALMAMTARIFARRDASLVVRFPSPTPGA
jgi:hypothetical protein